MPSTPYGTTNELVLLASSSNPLGRSNSSPDASVVDTTSGNFSSILRRQAYQRLDDNLLNRSNPPFNTGSAGRLMDGMPQISRGYIRRNVYDPNDPTSNYRLYFMYNPADIQRNYVAYIEQQALDPFNTIYGSNNLVAPPGILDFSFDLFFDRQTENATGAIPRGVMTDQEYFDLVVRGLIPDGQSPQLQDSGIMMINPRNITVVFGPQLSVQGRPYRASIQYQKFDRRMTPTRMTITLSMKAVYFGPQRADFAFASSQAENTFSATIPYNESIKYNIDYEEVAKVEAEEGGDTGDETTSPGTSTNSDLRLRALEIAESLGEYKYNYVWGGIDPYNPGVDCSGLVWWAYRKASGDDGAKFALGVSSRPATGAIMSGALNKGSVILGSDGAGRGVLAPMTAESLRTYAKRGDLLCGPGHVAFVAENKLLGNGLRTYEAFGDRYKGGPTPAHLDLGWSALLGYPNYHTMLIRPF
jgi:hypothetical protein